MSIVTDIKDEIAYLQGQLNDIQDACKHPFVAVGKTPKSGSSDGYSTDRYWNECYCGLCEKKWNEDQ